MYTEIYDKQTSLYDFHHNRQKLDKLKHDSRLQSYFFSLSLTFHGVIEILVQ